MRMPSWVHGSVIVVGLGSGHTPAGSPCLEGMPDSECKFYDQDGLALWAKVNFPGGGNQGPLVPLYHNGDELGDFRLIEAYDHVLPTSSFPLTWVNLASILYQRSTYQYSDGNTARFGTSIVASPSYRTPSGVPGQSGPLRFVPIPSRIDVDTVGVSERVRVSIQAAFENEAGNEADVVSASTFPNPMLGDTRTRLTMTFHAVQSVDLDPVGALNSDQFRFLTVSSMLAKSCLYDGNVLVFETPTGDVISIPLTPPISAGHLLPPGTELGSFFRLVKQPGSFWFPESPTIEVQIIDRASFPGQLGIQAFHSGRDNPNDDSLSVWLEWLDAPCTLPAGLTQSIEVMINATANGEPRLAEIGRLVDVLIGNDTDPAHVVCADWNRDGQTDGRDIQAMVRCIVDGNCQ